MRVSLIAVAIELFAFGLGGMLVPDLLVDTMNNVPLPGFIRFDSPPQGLWAGIACAMLTYLGFWYVKGAFDASDAFARTSVFMRMFALPLAFALPILKGHVPIGVLYVVGLDFVTGLWTYIELGSSSKPHRA